MRQSHWIGETRADPHPFGEANRDEESGDAWMGDEDAVEALSGSRDVESGAVEALRGQSPGQMSMAAVRREGGASFFVAPISNDRGEFIRTC